MIRIKKAAEILEISERTVRTWIKTGIIRAYRVNGLVFIDCEELFEDIKRCGSGLHEDSFGEEPTESEPGD